MIPTWLPPLVLICAFAGPAIARGSDEIDQQRWKSRLLVVMAPVAGDPRATEQRRVFHAAQAGSADRDLVLVEALGRDERSTAIRHRFGVPDGEFRAILVGKDGGAKLASATPITAERLFQEIDGMPMRQDEMRRSPARTR